MMETMSNALVEIFDAACDNGTHRRLDPSMQYMRPWLTCSPNLVGRGSFVVALDGAHSWTWRTASPQPELKG